MVHNISLKNLLKVDTDLLKVDTDLPKVDTDLPKVDTVLPKVDSKLIEHHKCNTCYKKFATKYTLKKHGLICNHKEHPNQCIECKNILSSQSALTHHKKYCKGIMLFVSNNINSNLPIICNNQPNVIQQNAQTINNITNNTVNINVLTCPQSREERFQFNCEDITDEVLMKILNYTGDSFIRFNKFVGKVLENPQNRVIRKTNPKDTHSLIHVGNDKWEYAHDKDTFSILTHHMTTAALDKTIKIEKNNFIKTFQQQVRIFNEMDYDSQDYHDIVQRIKYHVINITRSVLEEAQRIKV